LSEFRRRVEVIQEKKMYRWLRHGKQCSPARPPSGSSEAHKLAFAFFNRSRPPGSGTIFGHLLDSVDAFGLGQEKQDGWVVLAGEHEVHGE